MIRQKSFENDMPTLYLVPTPIGNLNEMTPRAIEILRTVDVIACEDTRTSGRLLKHFDIKNRLIAYQMHNEESSSVGILNLLEQGNNVALISDAGYPLINDPGQTVVSLVTEKGFNVVPLSGPNAMLNGLVASGLVAQPFIFIGFLPQKESEALKTMSLYKEYPMTMVFYETPHRITRFMSQALEVFGDRKCSIGREISKMHEEFIRGSIQEILEITDELKGEMVVVIEGKQEEKQKDIDYGTIMMMVNEAIDLGLSKKDAIKDVATKTGMPKNRVKDMVFRKEN